MDKTFIPCINKENFRKRLVDISEMEGSIVGPTVVVKSKIRSIKDETPFYNAFMSFCKDYNIALKYSEQPGDKDHLYKVTITRDGTHHCSITYSDKEKDISVELANSLCEVLIVQIENDRFVKKIKN